MSRGPMAWILTAALGLIIIGLLTLSAMHIRELRVDGHAETQEDVLPALE